MEITCHSNPCFACPVNNLAPAKIRAEAAKTIDVVLEEHSLDEINGANDKTVYSWGETASRFEAGFTGSEPIEFDIVFYAVRRIAEGRCPSRKIN